MLVDTSIWVEHLRHREFGLVSLLHRAEVQCHPFVIGEWLCSSINRRSEILQLLRRLPSLRVVENEEVMTFVERHRLMGRGVGWVGVHLLASAHRKGYCSGVPTAASLPSRDHWEFMVSSKHLGLAKDTPESRRVALRATFGNRIYSFPGLGGLHHLYAVAE